MRKVAIAANPDAPFRRAMIYDPADGAVGVSVFLYRSLDDGRSGRGGCCGTPGVSVFLYRSLDDGPCDCDYWYEDLAGAERHAAEALEVGDADWRLVPDPHPGCLDDWLAPVRVIRDSAGHPVYGQFERLPEQWPT